MLIATRKHTSGDKRRWLVDYSNWLQEHQQLNAADVVSPSATLTVSDVSIRNGKEVIFFLNAGTVGEQVTLTITVTCTDTEIKKDTMVFTVVAP